MNEKEVIDFIRTEVTFEIDIQREGIFWYLSGEYNPLDNEANNFFKTIADNTYYENIELIIKALNVSNNV